MQEYIKIQLNIREKLLFLFTNLIKKEKMINNNRDSELIKTKNKFVENGMNVELNDSIPDKIDIPFFELNNSTVQSNLNE
jgi:hypothetical protein